MMTSSVSKRAALLLPPPTLPFFAPRSTTVLPVRSLPPHPVNPNVVWDEKRKVLLIEGRVTRGLTTGLLRRSFYPRYDYKRAILGPSGPPSSPSLFPKKAQTDVQRKKAALRKGTRVHKRFDVVLHLMTSCRIPQREFGLPEDRIHLTTKRVTLPQCESVVRRYALPTLPERSIKAAAKKYRTLLNAREKHTQRLVSHWTHKGLRLWATERPVGIPYAFGTKVDAVLKDETDKIVLGETKTGKLGYLHKHTGESMNAPFNDQTDSPFNQDLIQLGFEAEAWCETHPTYEHRLTQPLIWFVTQTTVEEHPLPSWVSGRMVEALTRLLPKE